MNSISYRALLWNWVERRVLQRNRSRLLPQVHHWKDYAGEVKRGNGPPAIPAFLAAGLQAQLNSVTPRHMDVTIRVGPGGTATRIRSWRWLKWEASIVRSEHEHELESRLLDIVLKVQFFICSSTNRAWPSQTPLPDPVEEIDKWEALLPSAEVAIDSGVAKVWWERNGVSVVALDPIPFVTR